MVSAARALRTPDARAAGPAPRSGPPWIHRLDRTEAGPELLGAKGHGLAWMATLGLPVPPGFVVATSAGRAYLGGGTVPEGLWDELREAVRELEAITGRREPVTGEPGLWGDFLPSAQGTDVDLETIPAGLGTAVTGWRGEPWRAGGEGARTPLRRRRRRAGGRSSRARRDLRSPGAAGGGRADHRRHPRHRPRRRGRLRGGGGSLRRADPGMDAVGPPRARRRSGKAEGRLPLSAP